MGEPKDRCANKEMWCSHYRRDHNPPGEYGGCQVEDCECSKFREARGLMGDEPLEIISREAYGKWKPPAFVRRETERAGKPLKRCDSCKAGRHCNSPDVFVCSCRCPK